MLMGSKMSGVPKISLMAGMELCCHSNILVLCPRSSDCFCSKAMHSGFGLGWPAYGVRAWAFPLTGFQS